MKLLLVEDNLGDVGLIREAFASCQAEVEIRVARDGIDALDKLDRGAHADRPDLILLDLNLPRMDGRELLSRLKSDPALRAIPVVVFTSSNAPRDVARAYALQANCYLVKPPDLLGIERVVSLLNQFWLKTVRLP
jgi:chemotaxis family two-component system response regulator Rcp1